MSIALIFGRNAQPATEVQFYFIVAHFHCLSSVHSSNFHTMTQRHSGNITFAGLFSQMRMRAILSDYSACSIYWLRLTL